MVFIYLFFVILLATYQVSYYASPELYEFSKKNVKLCTFDPLSSNIYSVGIILLELLFGSSTIY